MSIDWQWGDDEKQQQWKRRKSCHSLHFVQRNNHLKLNHLGWNRVIRGTDSPAVLHERIQFGCHRRREAVVEDLASHAAFFFLAIS